MSVEADFRALLAAHAPLVALVGEGICESKVDERMPAPYVAFTVTHDYLRGLSGELLADQAGVQVACWARDTSEAWAVAEAVMAAISTAPAPRGAVAMVAAGTYDAEVGLDSVGLSVEWWG